MVGVLLPYLSEKLTVSGLGISEVLYVSGLFIGFLPFFTGYLSDKYGEKTIILMCSPFIASSFMFYTLATDFAQLILSRVLYGISLSFCAPAFLSLAGKSVKKFGGVGMGAFRASQGFAETLSPILGAILASLAFFSFPFYLSMMLVLLSATFIYFVIKEEPQPKESDKKYLEKLKDVVVSFKRNRTLAIACFQGFSQCSIFVVFTSFLPAILVSSPFFLEKQGLATIFSVEFLAFSVSSLIIGRLSDALGRKPTMALGICTAILELIGFYFSNSYLHVFFLSMLLGVSTASVFVTSSLIAADIIPKENMAFQFGAFDALMDTSFLISPFIFDLSTRIFGTLKVTFLVSSLITFFALILLVYQRETSRK